MYVCMCAVHPRPELTRVSERRPIPPVDDIDEEVKGSKEQVASACHHQDERQGPREGGG